MFSSLTIALILKKILVRLRAAAANRLRDQNPGIKDLSDPYRPLKLAEMVSELFDNEWTNAIENLEAIDVPEEKGIRILLKIIQVSLTEILLFLANLRHFQY